MPKVRVPRKNVTPDEVVAVLSRRLGPGYQVEANGGGRVTARKNPLMYANVSIKDQPGASVFGVHGGGVLFLLNTPLPRIPQPLTRASVVTAPGRADW